MEMEALFGDRLVVGAKSGEKSEKPTGEILDGKAWVLVYFGAQWAPPCNTFTPKLAEFYEKHAAGECRWTLR
eukprot:gene6392-7257_t